MPRADPRKPLPQSSAPGAGQEGAGPGRKMGGAARSEGRGLEGPRRRGAGPRAEAGLGACPGGRPRGGVGRKENPDFMNPEEVSQKADD